MDPADSDTLSQVTSISDKALYPETMQVFLR